MNRARWSSPWKRAESLGIQYSRCVATWKLTLEYDGTKYSGWQEQRNARTIAGELRKAAEDLLRSEADLHGAGRTDAGVHALAQVAHLRLAERGPKHPAELLRGLNSRLPSDIVVLSAERVSSRFHARHDALTRSYVYQISTRKTAFMKKHVWWVRESLDVGLMKTAAALLPGRHDFVCFRAADPARPDESTVVVVESAEMDTEEPLILFRIEASHFLWRMVRRVVGALVKVGAGELSVAEFEGLLQGKCNARLDIAGWTAPASGLFLESVRYPDDPGRRK